MPVALDNVVVLMEVQGRGVAEGGGREGADGGWLGVARVPWWASPAPGLHDAHESESRAPEGADRDIFLRSQADGL